LKLKGEDGMGLARRLRDESAIPIVMLTGRAEEADRVMGLELGADDYLTKPFSPRELLARIRTILRRRRAEVRQGKPEGIRAYRPHLEAQGKNDGRSSPVPPRRKRTARCLFPGGRGCGRARRPGGGASRSRAGGQFAPRHRVWIRVYARWAAPHQQPRGAWGEAHQGNFRRWIQPRRRPPG